jgi:hypothetical protein
LGEPVYEINLDNNNMFYIEVREFMGGGQLAGYLKRNSFVNGKVLGQKLKWLLSNY